MEADVDSEHVNRKVSDLSRALDGSAVSLVRDDIELDEQDRPRFTERCFELLDGGGSRREVANHFTTADLTTLALLGVPVSCAAALDLLDDRDARWSSLLRIPQGPGPTAARVATRLHARGRCSRGS